MNSGRVLSGPRMVSRSVLAAGFFITLIMAVQLLGPPASVGVYLFLGLWALTGPLGAIQALTLSWLTTYLNPGIFEGSELDVFLRWFVLSLAALRIVVELILQRERGLPQAVAALLVFAGVAAAISIARSYAVSISLLRVLTFAIGAGTVLLSFHLLGNGRRHLEIWFLGLAAVVVLGGLPLIVHELGYVRNSRGFQGFLNHPQAYGVFLAPLAAWGTAVLATGGTAHRNLWALLVLAAWISIFATESRTALIAAAGGLAVGGVHGLLGSVGLRERLKSRVLKPRPIALTCLTLAGLTVYGTHLQAELRAFATKGQPDVPLVEVFERSRGELVAASWANFEKQPVFGIGFGLASDPRELRPRSVAGLPFPVGASIEKGFLPTTVLEEVGIVGAATFLLLIICLVRLSLSSANLWGPVLVMSALLLNVGEMIFFTLGGSGLYMWLMVGFGLYALR